MRLRWQCVLLSMHGGLVIAPNGIMRIVSAAIISAIAAQIRLLAIAGSCLRDRLLVWLSGCLVSARQMFALWM